MKNLPPKACGAPLCWRRDWIGFGHRIAEEHVYCARTEALSRVPRSVPSFPEVCLSQRIPSYMPDLDGLALAITTWRPRL